MKTPTKQSCALSDMQEHVRKGGYENFYDQLNPSDHTFMETSKLSDANVPGILIGTYENKPGKPLELWSFLSHDEVVFIRNKSPPGEESELVKWSKVPSDKLPSFCEGRFASLIRSNDQSQSRAQEAAQHMDAMIKCLLLKSKNISRVEDTGFLTYLKDACKRMVRPTYRFEDFEVHGQRKCPDAYELVQKILGDPLRYLVEDQRVEFYDGEINTILCVGMGSDKFEKNGNKVWVASIEGNFYLFHKKAIRPGGDIVQVPTDMRLGPLGLDELAVSIRLVKEPVVKRQAGEQRLAAFIEYLYLLSGERMEIQGKADLLNKFEEACNEVYKDYVKKIKNAGNKNKEVKDALNALRNEVSLYLTIAPTY